MASSYEKGKDSELKAANWLKEKFEQGFTKKVLPVGTKIDGSSAFHNFDLVSDDNQIVAEVKSHQITVNGNVPSAKISDTYAACGMLEKVSAKQKLLILTDHSFYKLFRRYSDGKISRQIEIVCIDENQTPVGPEVVLPESPKNSFEVFWTKLAGAISSKQTIVNWTVKKGSTGENFEAGPVCVDCVFVSAPSALERIKVPKNDFKLMYDNWQMYSREKVSRGDLAKQSRFTKYTISIIHQYQNLMG
jgi:hypothetical protein